MKKGFSGITHMLIAIFLLFLCFIFLSALDIHFFNFVQSSTILLILTIFIVAGASLLPDLDNDVSSATMSLGLLGNMVMLTMRVLSSVATSITKLSRDKEPETQHRYLFHTPVVALAIASLWFFLPNYNILEVWMHKFRSGYVLDVFFNYIATHIAIFLIVCSLYMSFGILLYRLGIRKLRFLVLNVALLVSMYYILTAGTLQYLIVAVSLGYFFHILGDAFTQGSVPLFWPIPNLFLKQWWYKPRFFPFGKIETGGMFNQILNFVFLGLCIILGWVYVI